LQVLAQGFVHLNRLACGAAPDPDRFHQQAPTMQGILKPPPNKLLGLEALRFLAALAVLLWHYVHFAYIADKPVDLVRDQLPL